MMDDNGADTAGLVVDRLATRGLLEAGEGATGEDRR
jgi:hypothetical protein